MTSRLMARALLAACMFLGGQAALAAVTYSGTDGVYANIFNSNSQQRCMDCHHSALVGAARNAAPTDFNFDTYAGATAYSATYLKYVDAGVGTRAVSGGGMPPTGVDMTAAEYSLVAAWVAQRSGATAPPNTLAPDVTTSAASSVGKYAATLNASVNDNGADASYVFQYGLTTGYGSTTGTLTTVGTGGGLSATAISTTASGLSCGTTYHFRGRGTNSTGTTNGGDRSLTTSACPAVTSVSGSTTLNEDQSFSLTVSSTGSPTSYSLSGAPSGMTINSSTGAISWPAASTPDTPETSTTYNFTIVASDGTSSSNYNTSVTVTPVNDAPTFSSTAVTSASEGVAYSYDVNASDTEGDTLTYSLTTAPAGMSINSSTGVISWTPPQATANYSANVTVQVTDNGTVNGVSSPQSATQSFTITVTASNNAPSITSTATTSATESVAYSYTVTATDPEAQTLTYSLTTAPAGMSINSATGAISWTPPQALANYSSSVTVQVSDGSNNVTQSFTINVSADNDAPAFTSTDVTTAAENVAYSYTVVAVDPESQSLTYSLTTAPTGMSINASTGAISWMPPDQASTYTENVTVQVSDGTNTATRSFTITVTSSNDPPVFTSTAVTSATEAVAYSYTAIASDPEGGSLTYSLTTAPAGMSINSATGAISWTPPQALANYTASVTVRVTDGANPVAQSFTINVSADNDAPAFTSVAATVTSVAEDSPYSYTVTATDPEAQTLTYSLTVRPSGMSINAGSGAISWTPPLDFNGTENVTVQVSDGTNAVTRSFTITVTPVNDAPVIGSTAVTSSAEDSAYSYDVNASDVDGDTLTYSLTVKPTGMTINSSSGLISWTPPLNFNGTESVTVQVSDGSLNATQSFTLTITAVNDAPSIDSVAVTADDGSGTYSYDVDASDIDGDTLIYSLTTAPSGMIINSATGMISWTVPAAVSNPYAVTVRVADRADGSALTATQSFSVTVQDGDGDGQSDFFDNCPADANSDQANNDSDSEGDVCDSDDDNDGIPDAVELANGLDPFDAADAAGDLNNDGLTNLQNYQACGGIPCYSLSNPVIVTNGDQSVDASGYFTPVSVSATATGVGGPLTVTADTTGPFRPGVTTVTWTAPWRAADGSLQTATATQAITVQPRVSLGGSLTAAPGQVVNVPVRLNGESPAYPVTVTFSASGATAGVDFTVPAMSVQFASGETLQYLPVTLFSPAIGRTFTLTASAVAAGGAVLADASQRRFTIAVTTDPLPPALLSLTASQSGELRRVVFADDGTVTLDAVVSDPNGDAATCSGWSTPAALPVVGGSGCQLQLDVSGADAGLYTITVTATDGVLQTVRRLTLALQNSRPTLSGLDSDGDGIANTIEGLVDANGNGLLDYLDVTGLAAPESIQLGLSTGRLPTMATADSGLQLALGAYALAAQSLQQAGIQIFETQVADGMSPLIDADYAAIGAIFDFEVRGLTSLNRTAHVVLPLPVVLPPGVQWRQLASSGRWTDFIGAGGGSGIVSVASVAGSGSESLSSAPRDADGQCPAPQAAAYQPGLIAGMECVQLTVTDGGPNDADGQVNGSVRITGGPAVRRDEVAATIPGASQSGGSVDFHTLLVLALGLLGWRRKERF